MLLSHQFEMVDFLHERIPAADRARQRVPVGLVAYKLALVESGNAVRDEAIQAHDVAVLALEDDDRRGDVGAREARHVGQVRSQQIQHHRRVVFAFRLVLAAFEEELRVSSCARRHLARRRYLIERKTTVKNETRAPPFVEGRIY